MRFLRKLFRGCWHLMWACVPGCGQMCQGYMKRGISQTIIATALLFIAVFLEMGVLAVLIAPLWLYSFFDSFNLRRQIREGMAPEELLARLRALTRRQGQGEPPAPQGLAFADLRLDPSARSLHREGKSVQLSPKEFELLRLLMGRAGAVCPKGEILDRLWGGAEDNNLEAYISFLRKKFFYLGSRASIATLRKVGYRLDDPDRPA